MSNCSRRRDSTFCECVLSNARRQKSVLAHPLGLYPQRSLSSKKSYTFEKQWLPPLPKPTCPSTSPPRRPLRRRATTFSPPSPFSLAIPPPPRSSATTRSTRLRPVSSKLKIEFLYTNAPLYVSLNCVSKISSIIQPLSQPISFSDHFPDAYYGQVFDFPHLKHRVECTNASMHPPH